MELEEFIVGYGHLAEHLLHAVTEWDALTEARRDRLFEALHATLAERWRQLERVDLNERYRVKSALDPIDSCILARRSEIEDLFCVSLAEVAGTNSGTTFSRTVTPPAEFAAAA